MADVWAVIMAGGCGVRLWPLSRRSRSKQFLPLVGQTSLLRQTAERLLPLAPWDRMLVVLEKEQAGAAAAELPELPPGHLLREPARRNTAPAVALAAGYLEARDPEATMVVVPADHVISDAEAFRRVLRTAAFAAIDGSLVTLGIPPTRPETGYGYIELGPTAGEHGGLPVHRVLSFVEKPARERAEAMVAGRHHLWNSGIFVWRVSAIRRALARHLPDLSRALFPPGRSACAAEAAGLEGTYDRITGVSLDYGIMEKEEGVLVVPGSFGWNDLGSWQALDDVWDADENENRVRGDFVGVASRGITVHGGDRMVAVLGLEDLVVVDTPDALLICSKDRSQEVRSVVDRLAARGRDELL